MKYVFSYLKDYKKESVLAPLFKLLEALFDLFVPLVVARIIDYGIKERNQAYVFQQVGLLALLALFGITASITAQWFAAKASVGLASQLRQAAFDKVEKFSFANLDQLPPSTLITRLTSDINQVQTGFNMALRLLLRSPFIVFGSMIVAFTVNVKAALIFAVAIPLLALVVFGIMLVSIPLYRKVQKRLDEITRLSNENLAGVRVIRAFRKERAAVAKFDEKVSAMTKLNEFVGRLSAAMNPVTYVMINIAAIVLIQVGAVQVNTGAMAQGQVVALYNYLAQMIVELIKLASLIITINRAWACGDRVGQVLATENDLTYPKAGPKVTNSQVDFKNVSFTYPAASAPAVSNLTFTIKPAATVGIIGGTGSGKSTLLKLLTRFYDCGEGEIKLGGVSIKELTQEELLDQYALVPQKAQLFAGSIRDNLLMGRLEASDEELWQALSLAQAKDVVLAKPGQLDFQLEQEGRNLSGGQKQRLTIARALVKQAPLLILDDSDSALDLATGARLRQALASLKDVTKILVSQRVSSIMQADQILVLDDGKLVASGKHEELLANCQVYQEIYYSQFPKEKEAKEDKEGSR
ncbi:multidrug ABC transporter ATP-binding protein [Lactobacillus delbrueckii subsp. bulgaricus]|uniref:ABC transporter, ATP-binding / permease protein n=1 Tax=Lactobacillus delbrueckii subsp. bulgaricus (strain ATCC 11842 / DSM 20081 / BCRC 10696 / JCM 1002 / NBRC 13953 / NCIMB 11778 / NCTC 12712 / WDCM 00102 / Lb 14) TaxID=390333 RepID=Q1G9T4_LACDA|nr:ABC transporter ATP-binding protein [Lactobacillus delbrueckii]ALT47639.1 multidrug ABC transporter ATP-binding protein [Lactobacillus delbrueckii subsp. bulgaricus]KRN38380.1 ABC transporter ATP-binding permease [Lactobacillus delbrueckii subsp. bulgaricus ATCC 11842 = JCM 1002]MCD5463779.1 ABC transporter ATP-binding protein/permease [Lactobacillus delbrueckii subsp. bulgaricus]MCD5473879.1 ABC transporter ATP-binding protein/permease [Lactobacillus delbrueckii subsp. bulgaricus]MDG974886